MSAAARSFPTPRLVPPRPTPKKSSVPPPLPPVANEEDVIDVSDTAVHEFVAPPEPAPIEREAKTQHPGVVLIRTMGFFVAQLAVNLRAFVKAHWVRAAARAASRS